MICNLVNQIRRRPSSSSGSLPLSPFDRTFCLVIRVIGIAPTPPKTPPHYERNPPLRHLGHLLSHTLFPPWLFSLPTTKVDSPLNVLPKLPTPYPGTPDPTPVDLKGLRTLFWTSPFSFKPQLFFFFEMCQDIRKIFNFWNPRLFIDTSFSLSHLFKL